MTEYGPQPTRISVGTTSDDLRNPLQGKRGAALLTENYAFMNDDYSYMPNRIGPPPEREVTLGRCSMWMDGRSGFEVWPVGQGDDVDQGRIHVFGWKPQHMVGETAVSRKELLAKYGTNCVWYRRILLDLTFTLGTVTGVTDATVEHGFDADTLFANAITVNLDNTYDPPAAQVMAGGGADVAMARADACGFPLIQVVISRNWIESGGSSGPAEPSGGSSAYLTPSKVGLLMARI